MGVVICSMHYLPRLFKKRSSATPSRSKLSSYKSGRSGNARFPRRRYSEVDEYPLTYTTGSREVDSERGGGADAIKALESDPPEASDGAVLDKDVGDRVADGPGDRYA